MEWSKADPPGDFLEILGIRVLSTIPEGAGQGRALCSKRKSYPGLQVERSLGAPGAQSGGLGGAKGARRKVRLLPAAFMHKEVLPMRMK